MLKFQRNYKIKFEIGRRDNLRNYIPEEEVTVSYPTTLHMNVTHGINMSNISRGKFQLYNLSEQIQAKLWKDLYNLTKYITMEVYAGYGDNMSLIFRGDVNTCYSYRESGGVDFITDIQSDDGTYLFQYGICNHTFTKGTKFENLLRTLLEEVPLYKLGYITANIPPIKRDKTFIGQTMDLLGREYGEYQIFVDKGELNILGSNEVVPGIIPVLTAESGLLGSPRRGEQYLSCEMIFEPQLKIGQAIELISDSLSNVNNLYKVVGLTHSGTISPVESGTLITQVQLYMGYAPFEELKKSAPSIFSGQATTGIWSKPVQGQVSSYFGSRIQPTKGASHNHKGIDIATPLDTPVYAPANGKVTIAGWVNGYGNCIYMDNGTINNKLVTSRYGHLNRFAVNTNQSVSKGQLIGYVGSTGISTGPHLHFEIRENGQAVNPTKYIGNY